MHFELRIFVDLITALSYASHIKTLTSLKFLFDLPPFLSYHIYIYSHKPSEHLPYHPCSSTMHSLTPQAIAQYTLDLLEQRLKALQERGYRPLDVFQSPPRAWTVENPEDDLEVWTICRGDRVIPSTTTGARSPAPDVDNRIPGVQRSESPLLARGELQAGLVDNQTTTIASGTSMRWGSGPRLDQRIHVRIYVDGPKSHASKKGKVPSRTRSGIKKRASKLRFQKRMLRSTISTRSRRVTRFCALNSKGKPVTLI